MKLFLLITIFTTTEDYERGYGDGIAASKSASASMHMERFKSFKYCDVAGNAFIKQAGKGSSYTCTDLTINNSIKTKGDK